MQHSTKLNQLTQSDYFRKYVGSTALKAKKVYTGKNMIGIAQIPKSNAVPVFSAQQAKDTVKIK
jgi:hypothetical protein